MKLFSQIKAFVKDEEGASGLEYALLAVMVAVAIAAVTPQISTRIQAIFQNILTKLS